MDGDVSGRYPGEYDFRKENIVTSLGPTLRHVDHYFATLDHYFEAVHTCASKPTRSAREQLHVAKEVHNAVMGEAVDAIVDSDQTNEEKARTLANLLQNNTIQRQSKINHALGDAEIYYVGLDRDQLFSMFSEILGSPFDERSSDIDEIKQQYTLLLEQEYGFVMGYANNSRQGRFINAAERIGEHLLDVAKIGAGVVAGIWLTDYLKRR